MSVCLWAMLLLQDKEKPKPDPIKSLPYYKNYEKALAYVIERYPKVQWPQPAVVFSGMVFWLDGRPELKEHAEAAIKSAIAACKLDPEEFNGVWFVAYSAFFLSIVYTKDPRPEIKDALATAVKSAEQSQERTGGWLHHPGGRQLGGGYRPDIAFLTATMVTSLLFIKKHGIEVPQAMLDRALANLQNILKPDGLLYGTNGNRRDLGLCRVAAVAIGLKISGMSLYSQASGIPAAIPKTTDGHGFGPANFLSMAIATQVLGQYGSYGAHWLPKLASMQKEDGTVVMLNDTNTDGEANQPGGGRLCSSAVFCLMILMQKFKLIDFPAPASNAPARKSGFSQK